MARTFEAAFEIGRVSAYRVLRFREVHRLGLPPYAEIDVLLDAYLDPEDLVAQPAELAFGYAGQPTRRFAGMVDSVAIAGSSAVGDATRTFQYSFVVVSPLSLMGRNCGCAIFQDETVKGVVQAVLAEAAPSLPVEWRLSGDYPRRAYCVKYEESDLAFVSRLFEAEGISYFIETGEAGEPSLIVTDDTTAAPAIDGEASIPRRADSRMHAGVDAIFALRDRRALVSGKFVLRDFNFEKPKLDMTATAAGKQHTDLEVYDYPGGYFEVGDGRRLAQVRLEAEQATSDTLAIEADCTRISVGRKLTVTGSGSTDGDWMVAAVVHEYAGDESGKADYVCRAELLPAKVKYRPPRVTPRPVVHGPQTAVVMAPAGSRSEEIHTDQHGRCKVKFHWDPGPAIDDKATAWMRVSQLQTSGSMMLPRIGWEVVVEFLEGDPDRPIVTGRVYNGLFMPPYALPEGKTRTSIRTASTPGGGGSNEIRFEDKSGAEEIAIHSQHDTNVAVANNKAKNVGNNETLSVKVNSTTSVGSNQTVKVTKGAKATIGGNQSVSVGATRSVEVNAVAALNVGGSATTTVGGMQSEQIGNPLEALIALAAAKAAEFAAAKAAGAIAHVQGAVQGKIGQVLGPVQDLASKAEGLGGHMNALANGDLSAAGGLLAGASALPGVGAMAAAMNGSSGGSEGGQGGSGLAALTAAPGTSASAGSIAAGNMLNAAVGNAIQKATSKAINALDAAAGVDGGEAGGASDTNTAGPAGDVAGVDQTDRAKGPGHSTYKVTGSHKESVGAIKLFATLDGINTNIAGNVTQNVGAAFVQMAYGDVAEAVQGSKKEKELGLIVIAKGESEHVGGSKMAMVGGAVIDKVKGNMSLEAAANLTLIGAVHKIEASSSITLTCGDSTLTIDGGGITIKSAMVTLTGGSVQLPKPAAEGG